MSNINPLLQSKEPEYYEIELPSLAIPYVMDNDIDKIFEKDVIKNGVVKVRPLTTKDELIWTDEKLVEDLKAPMIVLRNTVLGLKKPELLIRADVETLLLQARILTYGPKTKVTWECSECSNQNSMTVDYRTLPIKKLEDETQLSRKIDKFMVYMTPIVFEEAVEIQKANDNDVSEQLDKIVSCISKVEIIDDDENLVDTVVNKAHIAEWVENANPKIFREIVDHFTEVNTIGTVMDIDVKCSHCGNKEKTDVVVDVTTFFSDED